MNIPIILFGIFYLYAVYFTGKNEKLESRLLILSCIVLTILIGTRADWPDMDAYRLAFERAPLLSGFSTFKGEVGYVETGYLFLASFVKTIYDNNTFYFLSMGALSMFLLYKSLYAYSAIPLIGLCCYISRFLLNRDFIQMRSSLAILLIVISIKFIYERKPIKYFLIVLLAYQFHHMALLGAPLYFLTMIRWKKSYIVLGIIAALVFSQVGSDIISAWVIDIGPDLLIQSYTEDEYTEAALGLANPMIYFQMGILFLLTFNEKRLSAMNKYYDIFKVGYFYSTVILIVFSGYTALSGRTSTLFATYEIFILPLLSRIIPKPYRFVYWLVLGVILIYFFYSKYSSAMMMVGKI